MDINLKRDFKGVWFPKEIWLDDRLSALDKIILLEIDSLDVDELGCYASNEYLAEFCQCGETKVSNCIKKLIELEYIELINFDGRTRFLRSCVSKKVKLPYKKGKAESQKVQPINNINLYNNKSLNKSSLLYINENNNLENKSSKLLENKNIRKGFNLGKPKKMTQKELLYHKLLDEILVKSPLYQNDTIRDLLIRWINALYEINKLPSSISLEDSLLELNKYDDNTIIETIKNSIKSNYPRFYIQKNISADGIERTRELSDYEIQKQEESYAYIDEKYGNNNS